jgi:predicted DNA-binding transcriptional regulator AlpA
MDDFKASLHDSATPISHNLEIVVDGLGNNSKNDESDVPSPSKETAKQNPAPFSYLSSKEVCRRIGYSRVHLWRKSRDPDDNFPAPYKLGSQKIGWRFDEIEAWVQSLERVSYAPNEAVMGEGARHG